MPFQPLFFLPAVFAEAVFNPYPNRKSVSCALSGVRIEPGDAAYAVRFETHNEAKRYWVSEKAALQHPEFLESVRDLEQRSYPASLIFYSNTERAELIDPAWVAVQKERGQQNHLRYILKLKDRRIQALLAEHAGLSLDKIREELAKPEPILPPPLPGDSIWEKVLEKIRILKNNPKSRAEDPWKFFGLVVMCDLHKRLAACFPDLQPELQVLLACSDNLLFGELADKSGILPDWLTIHALIAKSRLTLGDMLQLADWGARNPNALALLWKTHTRFGLLSFAVGNGMGFAELMENGHSAHMLYLFTARPELNPMLTAFDPDAEYKKQEVSLSPEFYGFVPSTVYQLPYLYRAKVFVALLAGEVGKARHIISVMREECHYYYHGSPDGFINATEKMAEQYIKKNT